MVYRKKLVSINLELYDPRSMPEPYKRNSTPRVSRGRSVRREPSREPLFLGDWSAFYRRRTEGEKKCKAISRRCAG